METVGVVLLVFGPLVAILVLLATAIRRLQPRPFVGPRWQAPPRFRDGAGDREPRRPLAPTLLGAVALPVPVDDRPCDEQKVPLRIEPGTRYREPGQRRAG